MKKINQLVVSLFLISFLFSCTKETVNNYTADAPPPANTQGVNPPQVNSDGTISGGGGKGVVCNINGKKSVELLDFYEARILYGLDITSNLNSQEEAVNRLAYLAARHYGDTNFDRDEKYINAVKNAIKSIVLDKIKFISSEKKLNDTQDSFDPLVEKSCELAQIAVFYDESTLLVDKLLWDQLNWTNKIGLVAHELFYFMHRQKGAVNSIMTRKLVGQLFSKNGAMPVRAGTPTLEKDVVNCNLKNPSGANVGYFQAFKARRKVFSYDSSEVEGVEFVFNSLYKQPLLFRTSLFYPGLELSLLKECTGDCDLQNSSPLHIESYASSKQSGYLSISKADKSPSVEQGIIMPPIKPIEPGKPIGDLPNPNDPKPINPELPPIVEPQPLPIERPPEKHKTEVLISFMSEGTDQEPVAYKAECSIYDQLGLKPIKPIVIPQPPTETKP